MDGTSGMQGEDDECIRNVNPKTWREEACLEGQRVDGNMILKRIYISDVDWIYMIIESNCGLLWM
jgi:hypothetical protein